MKKILSLLSILMLFGIKASADEWTKVSNAHEFISTIRYDHSAYIILTNDIDLSEADLDIVDPFTKSDYIFGFEFTGKIDGGGGEDSFGSSIMNSKHILFKSLRNAEITNIYIDNCKYDGLDTKSGCLSSESYNTRFENVIFGEIEGTGNSNLYDCDRMGVAVGYAEGCTFTNIMFLDCKLITDGSYLGMVAGQAKNCKFNDIVVNQGCELWGDGNFTSDNSAYVGGICGYIDNCEMEYCTNFGKVTSDDDRLGGIVGYATNSSTVSNCRNGGVVRHCTRDGYGRVVRRETVKNLLVAGFASSAVAIVSAAILSEGGNAVFNIIKGREFSGHTNIRSAIYGKAGVGLYVFYHAGYQFLKRGAVSVFGAKTLKAVVSRVVANIPVISTAIAAGCFATAAALTIYDVLSVPDEVGGIAGTVDGYSIIKECTNEGPVECKDEDCGGIVGHLENALVKNCYNRSFVKGGSKHTGGIVGYSENGTIITCLNVGPVSGKTLVGNIVGNKKNGTVEDNYCMSQGKSKDEQAEITFTQDNLASGQIACELNKKVGRNIWRQNLGKDFYPVLNDTTKAEVTSTTDNYSLVQDVYDCAEFFLAAANPEAQIHLQDDINLNNYYFNLSTSQHPFKGTIEGNGHTLSNCSYVDGGTTSLSEYSDAALFSYTEDATFKNMKLNGFSISQRHDNSLIAVVVHRRQAFLSAVSKNCTYQNISIANSRIYSKVSANDFVGIVGGLVAYSNHDTFEDCTLEASCELNAYAGSKTSPDATVGGIAAIAENGSTFTRCFNAAYLHTDDDHVGGIVGDAYDCSINYCLNTGELNAEQYVGGIAAYAKNTPITHCVNTGTIWEDNNSWDWSYRSGIVGYLEGTGATVAWCLNYGSINYAPESSCSPINNKRKDGASYGDGNYFYCQFNGKHLDNVGEVTYNNMKSGEYALNMTDNEGNHWLYQSLDNEIDFPTTMPVPIPAAGKVYSNINCYWKQLYSNIYHSVGSHDPVLTAYGICSLCGDKKNSPAAIDFHISDADGMLEFAHSVNRGVNLSGCTVYLDNDIDMSGHEYVAVGKNFDNPFQGNFDGQGHRIKNASFYGKDRPSGVFGCVSGTSSVKHLIVDSSCHFSGNGYGTAGIVGCLALPSESSSDSIDFTMQECGNEADINGVINASGLIGGVYNTDTNGHASVTIENCYNTGEITGERESAAFIAYGNKNVTVINCYNAGFVTGHETDHTLIRCKEDANIGVSNLYNMIYVDADNQVDTTYLFYPDQANYGELCTMLNKNNSSNIWEQNLEEDSHPRFGSKGLNYQRELSTQWGTLVLPFAITSSPDVQYYTIIDYDSNAIWIKPMDSVEPNTPCIFKVKNGSKTLEMEDVNFTVVTPETYSPFAEFGNVDIKEGKLIGTYSDKAISTNVWYDNYYINGEKFWKSANEFTLPSFRCFLQTLQSANSAKTRSIMVEATGISVMGGESSKVRDGKYLQDGKVVIIRNGKRYSLAGQIAL